MQDHLYANPSRVGKTPALSECVVRFPDRRRTAIFILDADGGWLVLGPRGHGWLHGDRAAALDDAAWLSRNMGLPVREVAA
jgi:hypothetical protein